MVTLLLLGTLCARVAAGVVPVDAATTEVHLTPFLSLYRDASGRQTLADVRQAWARGQLPPGPQRWPTFGFTPDAVWARVTVHNQGREPGLWFIELQTPRMDEVDGYVLRSTGQVEHVAAGNQRAPSPPQVDHRHPVFPLSLSPGEQAEFLLRVHSETSVQLPLAIWGAKAFATAQAGTGVFDAVFFGYLLALLVLGLVFGAFTRDPGFLLYSLSQAGSFACYVILGGYWTWLDLPGRTLMVKNGLLVAGEFGAFMTIAFLRRQLDLGRLMPRVDRWAARAMWAGAAATVVLLAVSYRISFPLFVSHQLLLGAAALLVALVAWRRGNRVARFYALAWVVFWVCYGVSSLHFLTRQTLPHLPWIYSLVGMAVSSTLFLVAMADRVRDIRNGALAAQTQLLAVERQASADLRLKMRQEQLLIRDLHDGIGGLTANLAILAEVGRRDAPANPERDRFARISQLASDGGAEIRSLMSSLEAREMSWPDFFDDCRRHAQLALAPHGIEFELRHTGDPDPAGPGVFPGLSLLRVVKEALTNAVKHAGCTRVTVQADFTPQRLRLTVRDNGRGLAPAPGGGRGLRNMGARLRELGGTMATRSDTGLELVFELPLPVTLVDTPPENPA